jgi:hypothetical protein
MRFTVKERGHERLDQVLLGSGQNTLETNDEEIPQ